MENSQKKDTDWSSIGKTALKLVAPAAVFGGMIVSLRPVVETISSKYGPFAVIAILTPYLMTILIFFMALVLIILQQRQIDRVSESRDRIQDTIIKKRLSTLD